jgi:hypothetical protein
MAKENSIQLELWTGGVNFKLTQTVPNIVQPQPTVCVYGVPDILEHFHACLP